MDRRIYGYAKELKNISDLTFDDLNGWSLDHYGIPGQKWGVRRFQNEDGTLTAADNEPIRR